MKLKLLSMLALGSLLVAPAQAAVSISVTSLAADPFGPKFATSNGNLLPAGSIIRYGSFDTSGGNLAMISTSNDIAFLNTLFKPLGEGALGAGTLTQSGNLGNIVIVNDFMTPGGFMGNFNNVSATHYTTGTQLYAWVFNSSSMLTATEWGIFTASGGWFFPNDLGSETLNNMEIDTILRGSTTGDILKDDRLMLSQVPEPAGALLVLCSGLWLHGRRLRRHL